MNQRRRDRLAEEILKLQQARSAMEAVVEEEKISLDNTPDNLTEGERYAEREENAERLEELVGELEELIDALIECM